MSKKRAGMTNKELKRAAYHLKQWADVLRDSYRDGGKEAEAEMAESAEMAALSRKLYALARETDKRPAPAAADELQRLRTENDRLTAWLIQIDGGDSPCTDESQLRQWAYDAVTLSRAAPQSRTPR